MLIHYVDNSDVREKEKQRESESGGGKKSTSNKLNLLSLIR